MSARRSVVSTCHGEAPVTTRAAIDEKPPANLPLFATRWACRRVAALALLVLRSAAQPAIGVAPPRSQVCGWSRPTSWSSPASIWTPPFRPFGKESSSSGSPCRRAGGDSIGSDGASSDSRRFRRCSSPATRAPEGRAVSLVCDALADAADSADAVPICAHCWVTCAGAGAASGFVRGGRFNGWDAGPIGGRVGSRGG